MKQNCFIFLFIIFSTLGYSQFNSYVPQNNIDAVKEVGLYKQKKYDKRKQWIQGRIYQLNDLIYKLFNSKNLPSDVAVEPTRNIYILKLKKYTTSISTNDFADDYQFTNIEKGFKSLENDFYSGYNSIIEN